MSRELQIISTVPLTDHQSETILCVAIALSGIRMDMDVQDILDICVELFNQGHPWDNIGLAVLGASKGEGIH